MGRKLTLLVLYKSLHTCKVGLLAQLAGLALLGLQAATRSPTLHVCVGKKRKQSGNKPEKQVFPVFKESKTANHMPPTSAPS